MTSPTTQLRESIRDHYLDDEATAVEQLLTLARLDATSSDQAETLAASLVSRVRARQQESAGLQSFIQEYDLSSQEGVLLMCIAEALLRIPDSATADRLIRDKLVRGDWSSHLGPTRSLLVNAGTWGLLLTGKLVDFSNLPVTDWTSGIRWLTARLSEPVVRAALRRGMKLMAEEFVMGRTIDEAVNLGRLRAATAVRYSFDMLGESAFTAEDAQRYFVAYEHAIDVLSSRLPGSAGESIFDRPGISVKLSALHPRFEPMQRDRVLADLAPRVLALVTRAREANIGLTLDAEEVDRLELLLDIVESVFRAPALSGWEGFGLAVQAYQKRGLHVIDWLACLARSEGRRLMVRLVKGAYWDAEIKRAQVGGLAGYPVFTRKANTDVSFLACAARMLAAPDAFYGQFATHNAHTVASLIERGKGNEFEFQRLHGMGKDLYDEVARTTHIPCRVYAPVGSHEDLLPYLVRRLLENGSNSSFVNRVADTTLPVASLVQDPVKLAGGAVSAHGHRLPLPESLYRDRRNSRGIALGDERRLGQLLDEMAPFLARRNWHSAPIVASGSPAGIANAVSSPADGETIGHAAWADAPTVDAAVDLAVRARVPSALERAEVLERAADAFESHAALFLALLVREAGKTLPDAQGELRETADFCRYYALLARRHFDMPLVLDGPTGESNELRLEGRGPFVCISPWNFPLALFVGQVAAAFAAGNPVLAKPAEQTPLVAHEAVTLLHRAGIPVDVLAFLPGTGEQVGAALVRDPRTAGVAFTGSTETAKAINRALADRPGPIVPFIAETGGLNAMIVDSSALPEQVVSDVVASAFNSAGQRCSALRILCIQEEIAPRLLKLLAGVTAELVVGDPAKRSTDIGPVIDHDSLDRLQAYCMKLDKEATLVCRASLPHGLKGHYFAPRAYLLPSLDLVDREVFGPLLHIVTFKSGQLLDTVRAINAKGFGLTLGVHSRIDEAIESVRRVARVGNLYVNRNMIGATVGVQPFGGEGLSGTGPKAGGPNALHRYATERTFTVNTTAAGGNAALIAAAD